LDNLKAKGARAFIWDFSGKMATQGMGFVISIFLARLLEPSEFGLIAMVMVIIGMADVFTDVGLGGALIQRKKVLSVHYSSVFYFNLFIGSLLTLITYFSSRWIGAFYNNAELIPLAQVMSLSFVINAFSSVQISKLRKELNFAAITKSRFMASLLSGGLGVSLAFYGYGVWSLVAQTLSMGLFLNIFIWSISRWSPSLLFSFKALTQLWGFGFRMFLSSLLDAVFTRLDYLLIGKLFMPTTLGYFQRAKSLNLMVIQYSSSSLMRVLFPVLSKIQNDLPRLRKIIVKMTGVISFVVFLLLGGLYLVSEELIILLFGDKWRPSVNFFQILVFSGFGYPVSALLINVLRSRGNSKAFLRLEIYKKILMSINFFVLYFWGIDFYLYGLIITVILSVSLNIFFASREINVTFIRFAVPIIDQAMIAAVAVGSTLYLLMLVQAKSELFFKLYSELSFLMQSEFLLVGKGLFFTLMYFLLSWLLKTNAYRSFSEQIFSVVKPKRKKT
jgi:O-antigen/teichoic acid export membrane protein